jgi:hypothetical protein
MSLSASALPHQMELLTALLALGCAGPTEDVRPVSPAPPPPATSQILNLGYDQAVALGASFAQSRGYQMELAMAELVDGAWWLSYVAGPGHPGLKLRVDGTTGAVEPLDAAPAPAPPAPTP